MHYKGFIIGALVVAALAGIMWWGAQQKNGGNATTPEEKSNGLLVSVERIFDFGSISMAAGNVKHTFAVKNTGSEAVRIRKMYTSCMCTSAILTIGSGKRYGPFGMPGHGFIPSINTEVRSGEEINVEVIFDPAAHGPAGIGEIERLVALEHNAGESLELNIRAVVTP